MTTSDRPAIGSKRLICNMKGLPSDIRGREGTILGYEERYTLLVDIDGITHHIDPSLLEPEGAVPNEWSGKGDPVVGQRVEVVRVGEQEVECEVRYIFLTPSWEKCLVVEAVDAKGEWTVPIGHIQPVRRSK